GQAAPSLSCSNSRGLFRIPPPHRRKGRLSILGKNARMSKAIPSRRTRLINAVLWDHVMIPQEHAIEGPCRRDKLRPILGEYHRVDQRVDRGILNPDIITRSQ